MKQKKIYTRSLMMLLCNIGNYVIFEVRSMMSFYVRLETM